ncbi:phage major capsid protein [Crenobacter cavernae]|uniref:Phage major capsid protein n=1 Tax=Crenobacter cavernae TaxID=2290923 RepID=A0A345Y6S4_9NEIS|nr:phage major capsid protein [Crenobacter cavernae]AXK39626.1 phage major capsid protein [Crenobacter cavernae]
MPRTNKAYRNFEVRAEQLDTDARTIELSFSSEEPYERWWGIEILDHSTDAVRLGRLGNRAPLLMDHNTRDQVGVVENVRLVDGVGRATVRFGKSERAEEIWQDVQDGIRGKVSVGYQIHGYQLESKKDDTETYRITDWEPYEISIVSVPADDTVGVGRSADDFAPAAPPAPESEADRTAAPASNEPQSIVETRTMTVQVNESDILAAERSRIAEINAIATQFGMADAGARAVAAGTSVNEFRAGVLDDLSKRQGSGVVRADEDPSVGLTNQEAERFSFRRLIAGLADPTMASEAAFEMEACRAAAAKRSQIAKGKGAAATIPHEVVMRQLMRPMLKRDLVVGTPTAGGNLVATELETGSFIDLLVNRMALTNMGITRLTGLSGNVAIPRQTGGVACYWVAENGAPTESAASFDQVALTPKTIAAFTEVSRLLLTQSSLDIEAFIQMDIQRSMALGLDLAGINGSGAANQPRGILNTAGIGAVIGGTNGAAPTWDHLVDLESAVASVNADAGAMRYLTNTKVRGKLKKTQQFSGTNGTSVWDALGSQIEVSNQVPSNLTKGTANGVCSGIVYGNFADLIMGLWGGLDILVDPYSNSTTGAVRVTAFQSADFSVRHAESFAAMVDALTA